MVAGFGHLLKSGANGSVTQTRQEAYFFVPVRLCFHAHVLRDRDRQTDRETDRWRETETDGKRERARERERERETSGERERGE